VGLTRCRFDYNNRTRVLSWLEKHVQENCHESSERYNMSTISQFIEWRSRDLESWIMRITGTPPRGYVEIKDEKFAVLFILKWSP
jgi:hypothetical protein